MTSARTRCSGPSSPSISWGRRTACRSFLPATTMTPTRASPSSLVRQMVEQAAALHSELDKDPHAEAISQAAACAAPILAAAHDPEPALAWLADQLEPWERDALQHAEVLSTEYPVLST